MLPLCLCRGIFATHLHLLVDLLGNEPNIELYRMEVVEREVSGGFGSGARARWHNECYVCASFAFQDHTCGTAFVLRVGCKPAHMRQLDRSHVLMC